MDAAQADVSPVLQAVSRELKSLGDMGAALQSALSSPSPRSEDIQALDALTQRLFVLADFLGRLAPTVTQGGSCDLGAALDAVNLADVAQRLGADALGPEGTIWPGELELFGDEA